MNRPIRIQLSRRKGFTLADAAGNDLPTVKVDRTTDWGNPYLPPTKDDNGRTAAVEGFRRYCPPDSELALAARRILRGKNLACWCPIGSPCHADVLLEIANAAEERKA